MKDKLRIVFTFYASFGDRGNVNALKSNTFHKMMSDAGLRDSQVLTPYRLDLLFVKANRHGVDFETFLTLLTSIASIKYSVGGDDLKVSHSHALQILLKQHFLPLYASIMAETDLG